MKRYKISGFAFVKRPLKHFFLEKITFSLFEHIRSSKWCTEIEKNRSRDLINFGDFTVAKLLIKHEQVRINP